MIDVVVNGVRLRLETDARLFSPGGPDVGTMAMLSLIAFRPEDKVLDLGCGYGLVGVLAAKYCAPGQVVMLDSDPLAVALARRNADANDVGGVKIELSDGFRSTRETGFSKIVSNPPYHVDFSVPKHFIEKSFNRLELGGTMWMVTKRLDWYRNKLGAIFGGCRVHEIDGYYVFESVKQRAQYAKTG